MATSTTNYGLTKPAYNESADVAVINTNMDTIDEVMGKNQTAATGAQKAIAIVADGDSHVAIKKGDFVYVKNNTHSLAEGLYTASANVSANGNITGSNMTAVSNGGLNAIKIQAGRESYTHGSAQTVVSVTFDYPFSSVPTIVATEENAGGYPVRCWVREVSTTGFKVNTYYENFSSSFSAYLHWIAAL